MKFPYQPTITDGRIQQTMRFMLKKEFACTEVRDNSSNCRRVAAFPMTMMRMLLMNGCEWLDAEHIM